MFMSFKKIKPYLISIAIALAAGGLGGIVTYRGLPAYEQLTKPPLTPPSIVFPIVWTILYVLMGISAAIIYQSPTVRRDTALAIYALQLLFNILWSVFFFGMQAYLFSFLWLVLLWLLILLMIKSFSKINKTAALLQIPYLLWVTFAGYLNFAIWMLNKS